jgi:hypothetical protein
MIQERTALAHDYVRGSIAVLEQIIHGWGPTEFERRRAVDMFQTIRGRLLAALDVIEKELKATQ